MCDLCDCTYDRKSKCIVAECSKPEQSGVRERTLEIHVCSGHNYFNFQPDLAVLL